jgi:hypothetical protein
MLLWLLLKNWNESGTWDGSLPHATQRSPQVREALCSSRKGDRWVAAPRGWWAPAVADGLTPALVHPAYRPVHEVERAGGADLQAAEFVERVARENTRQQMRAILERSPILEHLFREGRIGIVGGMYSVETDEVMFFEQAFQSPAPAATMAAAR